MINVNIIDKTEINCPTCLGLHSYVCSKCDYVFNIRKYKIKIKKEEL